VITPPSTTPASVTASLSRRGVQADHKERARIRSVGMSNVLNGERKQRRNHVIGCYVGVLGETALRMTEGLKLKWKFVNLGERNLTVEASKNYKTRHLPLSDYAIELLRSLPSRRLRICLRAGVNERPLSRPAGSFDAGRGAVGLDWVGLHDFRHFRASRWVMRGIAI